MVPFISILTIWLLLLTPQVFAQEEFKTTGEAFNAGKAFANTAKDIAGEKLTRQVGAENLPYYTTEAPEGQHFQKGRSLISDNGRTKQQACKTQRAANGFEQQECDAINFLSKNASTRTKFKIDKNTDPILVGSKNIINNPGSVPGTRKQNCRIEKIAHPATFLSETCTESMTLDNLACHIRWEITVHEVHEIRHGQSCVSFKGVGNPSGNYAGPTQQYGLNEARQATAYLDQGYNQLYVQGSKIGEYTPWQKDNCYIHTHGGAGAAVGEGTIRGVLAIWKDAGGYITPGMNACTPAALNRVGYGATMNLCKTGCSSYQKTWVCGGPSGDNCNWAYTCDNNNGSAVCPAGWVEMNGACREEQFNALLARQCTLSHSAQNPLVVDGSDTIHYFYCTKKTNECADFEARSQ